MVILLADRGARVSFISTPVNAARAAAAARAGVSIDFVELPFPCAAVGLPDGCENLDLLPSLESHHVSTLNSSSPPQPSSATPSSSTSSPSRRPRLA
ncbi:hypothetical protein Cni_G09302 [Canna indica]|uniref:Uncharacterized protein n=1 Tax=Canna indica TaxID=4628 RepID=A0AAQ3K3R2_9LILI|nr:hypothetical protein Cni_G09302 [Canna indica]